MMWAMGLEMAAGHAPGAVMLAGAVILAVAAAAAIAVRRGRGCEAAVVDALVMLAVVFLPVVGAGHHSAVGMPLALPAGVVLAAWLLARRALAARMPATMRARASFALSAVVLAGMLLMQLIGH